MKTIRAGRSMTAFADPGPTTMAGPQPPAHVMRGPEHADNYRLKVGRYRERWYRDPLPYCELAPEALDGEAYPSVSTVKGASGKDWTYTTLKRVANSEDLAEIAAKGFFERYERLKVINSLDLSKAMRRGTDVHSWAEYLAYGQKPTLSASSDGAAYFDTVDKLFAELQPELVAAEFVCIHRTLNGVGYGGTSDGIFRIDGKLYKVDWKSRGEDSDHGCYPEEAGQLGAYAGAEYIIVADDDPSNPHGAKRLPVPPLDGGLIVSIKPDSYEVYPVDLDKAAEHFAAMHAWWVARRDESKPIGSKWAPRRAVTDRGTAADDDVALADELYESRKNVLLERHTKLTARQQEEFAERMAVVDASDLDAVEQLLNDIEHPPTVLDMAKDRMKADTVREADRRLALEGGPADDTDVHLFELRWDMGMENPGRRWIGDVVTGAVEAGLDFRLSTMRTQRRADIYCALTEWVATDVFDPRNDEGFRAAVRSVTEDNEDDGTLGVLVGQLTTGEASALRALVSKIEAGEAVYVAPASGAPHWEFFTPTTSESEKP